MAGTPGGILWNHASGTSVTGISTFTSNLNIGTAADPITTIIRGATNSINGNHEFTCSGSQLGDIVVAVPDGGSLAAALGDSSDRKILMTAHVKSKNTCQLRFVNAGSQSGHYTRIGNSGTSTPSAQLCYHDTATTRTEPGADTNYNQLAVTCCNSARVGSRNNCDMTINYDTAASICSNQGKFLCTDQEISEGTGAGTGCSHDNRHVWTSTPCDINFFTSEARQGTLHTAEVRSWNIRWMTIRVTN
jgi:hypothetical protein